MPITKKRMVVSFASASMLLFAAGLAQAGGPVALTDRQLDGVTASSAIVFGTSSALATGLIAQGTSQSTSAIGTNPSVENGFGAYGGVSEGSADALGINGSPSSSTDVQTGGAAQGNFVLNLSGGGKLSTGNFTIQAGFTSVYGVFVPGL